MQSSVRFNCAESRRNWQSGQRFPAKWIYEEVLRKDGSFMFKWRFCWEDRCSLSTKRRTGWQMAKNNLSLPRSCYGVLNNIIGFSMTYCSTLLYFLLYCWVQCSVYFHGPWHFVAFLLVEADPPRNALFVHLENVAISHNTHQPIPTQMTRRALTLCAYMCQSVASFPTKQAHALFPFSSTYNGAPHNVFEQVFFQLPLCNCQDVHSISPWLHLIRICLAMPNLYPRESYSATLSIV